MTPLIYLIAGYILCLFLSRYHKMAVSLFVLIFSIAVAYRVTAALIPEIAELNWRGFWSGAGLGTIAAIVIGALWFWVLGWRARADQTMLEKIERAKADNAKERKIA